MTANLEHSSSFYTVYAAQAEIINSVIEKAIKESAAKMGKSVNKIYSFSAESVNKKVN